MTQFRMLRIGQSSAIIEKLLILSLVFSLSHVNGEGEGSEDSEDEIEHTTYQKMKNFGNNVEVVSNSTYPKPIRKIKIKRAIDASCPKCKSATNFFFFRGLNTI